MTVPAIDALLARRSMKLVRGPAPKPEELDLILAAAMRAPDHGALRPWRFALIRGAAIGRFTELALATIKRSARIAITPEKEHATRQWLAQVPLLVAMAYQIEHDNPKVPEQEQTLSMGCAVMNMLNATAMLGYAAFWSTGLGCYIEEMQEALGFDPLDYRFVGYLAIGTPACELPKLTRPDPDQFVREWVGATDASTSA